MPAHSAKNTSESVIGLQPEQAGRTHLRGIVIEYEVDGQRYKRVVDNEFVFCTVATGPVPKDCR